MPSAAQHGYTLNSERAKHPNRMNEKVFRIGNVQSFMAQPNITGNMIDTCNKHTCNLDIAVQIDRFIMLECRNITPIIRIAPGLVYRLRECCRTVYVVYKSQTDRHGSQNFATVRADNNFENLRQVGGLPNRFDGTFREY